ncbi:BTAD domain-containing putative transcriptional regulator [Dactylosporangium sp. NPDC048998]|uniref:BTAD domain-containing putative transcriptional regulator n=1 Tax=Dactylosporangium sp. NPDC048998 TaxID=3363976 RepID=UPI0037188DCE
MGGVNQRATLGALLLQANNVVATRQLLKALWRDDPPATARKMLQNAVAGLRATFAAHGTDARLLTYTPGYLLRVDPDSVDLLRFQRLVERGRAAMATGGWEAAVQDLREALALWRGPALADLLETGLAWPQLDVLRNAHLAALEDYVEVQLATGQHYAVIGEIEQVVAEIEPPRERLCRQLMLALYRCGRQADALSVYRRTRTVLAEKLGLDPGRELQELERAILSHDPALTSPAAAEAPTANTVPVAPVADAPPEPRPVAPGPVRTERKRITFLQIDVPSAAPGRHDPHDVTEVLAPLTAMFRAEVERLGGRVQGTPVVGPRLLALFGAPRTGEDDAERATRAALAIRDRLRFEAGPATSEARIAVATAETLVTYQGDPGDAAATEVTGSALDTCRQLLAAASPGTVRVCAATLTATRHAFVHRPVLGPAGGAELLAVRQEPLSTDFSVPFLERDNELEMLHGLLKNVRRRRRPHLVTVLGDSGIGKSRLVEEFGRRSREPVRWLVGQVPQFGSDAGWAALAEVIGPDPGGPGTVKALEDAAAKGPLVIVIEDLHRADDALLSFVEELVEHAARLPVLLITTARPELLVRRPQWSGGKRNATMITLEPLSGDAIRELLKGLALRHGMCGRPAGSDVWRDRARDEAMYEAFLALIRCIGGNPRFAIEYFRMSIGDGDETARHCPSVRADGAGVVAPDDPLALPQSVRSAIAATLDMLSPLEKAVLQDAAVFGETVWGSAVAALGRRDVETVERCMERLERRDILCRAGPRATPDESRYVFRHVLVRDVAYSQLPRSTRVEKHLRAALWIEGQAADEHPELLGYHYKNAISLAVASGHPTGELTDRAHQALAKVTRENAGRQAVMSARDQNHDPRKPRPPTARGYAAAG